VELENQLQSENVHYPAGELDGCGSCHASHTSDHISLLHQKVPDTCLDCHDTSAAAFGEEHLGLAGADSACTSCHDPHASETVGLLLPVSHQPFADGDCSLCHETEREPGEGGV